MDFPASGSLCHVPFTKANREKQPARRETCGHVASRADGTTLAEAPPEPDPHLGAPGAHRCMDRTPARGHRPADRRLQARERPRPRRGERRGGGRRRLRRRDRSPRGRRCADRRRARGGRGAPRRGGGREGRRRRGGGRQGRRREGRQGRGRRRGRGRGLRERRCRDEAPPRSPRWSRTRAPRPVAHDLRGHVRPRRGGLRTVARPRGVGQPDLRGALGGPPPGRGHGRGGSDRDPPRPRPTTTRATQASIRRPPAKSRAPRT